jgi:hypothetical protein
MASFMRYSPKRSRCSSPISWGAQPVAWAKRMKRERPRFGRRGSLASSSAQAPLSLIFERAGARREANSRKAPRTKLLRLAKARGLSPVIAGESWSSWRRTVLGSARTSATPWPIKVCVRFNAQHRYFFRRVGIVSLSSIASRMSPSATMVPASLTGTQVVL